MARSAIFTPIPPIIGRLIGSRSPPQPYTTISRPLQKSRTEDSTFSSEEDAFTALSTSALLAKSSVPYSHRRVADNYVIIKKIYRFQAVQAPITNTERQLLQKYDFNTLEFSTIKQINDELSYLKKWATSS